MDYKNLKSQINFIIIVFSFNQNKDYKLLTPSCKSKTPVGLFSTRSPYRPNNIGLTTVKITKINKNEIEFSGADMLDKTPVFDIKPYIDEISNR